MISFAVVNSQPMSKKEYVVLVNEADEKIGLMEKIEAHEKALLHRAFSVFLFNNKNQLLIQQRALSKYHSPGEWANTCCSHQRDGESTLEAAHRRLGEEMGIDTELKEEFTFIYKQKFGNGLTEHELDHVVFGTFNEDAIPNPDEVGDWKYISIEALQKDIIAHPNNYTIWLKIALNQVIKHLNK